MRGKVGCCCPRKYWTRVEVNIEPLQNVWLCSGLVEGSIEKVNKLKLGRKRAIVSNFSYL
jgi:hypothetical protein